MILFWLETHVRLEAIMCSIVLHSWVVSGVLFITFLEERANLDFLPVFNRNLNFIQGLLENSSNYLCYYMT